MDSKTRSSLIKDLCSTLTYKNFYLLIGGETISSMGDWLTTIALSIALFQQSDSPFTIGLLFAIRMLPPILFGIFGGICADAYSKKRTLIISEFIRGVCILSLFFIHTPIYSYCIVFIVAMANAFSHPALMASIKNCTREEDLGKASSLVTGSKLLAMIVGTGSAGLLYSTIGLEQLFIVDAATFFIFVMLLIPIDLSESKDRFESNLKERFEFFPFFQEVRKNKSVVTVLQTTILFSFLLSLWLTLQLSLFAEVFSSSVSDLTYIRFVTSIGLVMGVIFGFKQSGDRYVWMSATGFVFFALALFCVGMTSTATILILATTSLGFFEAVHMTGNRSHLLKSSTSFNSGKMMSMRKICESIGFISASIVVGVFSQTLEAHTLLLLCSVAATFTFIVIHRENISESIRSETLIRWILKKITDRLPVKVMKDEHGRPFLYRYHIGALSNNGPGICIHRFCMSDPDRGFHDHPWSHACSFVLAGRYEERLNAEKPEEKGRILRPGQFNYVNGKRVFHRVMLEEGEDAWTIFAFGKRTKGWGFRNVRNGQMEYNPMTSKVKDLDGGWWKTAPLGRSISQ